MPGCPKMVKISGRAWTGSSALIMLNPCMVCFGLRGEKNIYSANIEKYLSTCIFFQYFLYLCGNNLRTHEKTERSQVIGHYV